MKYRINKPPTVLYDLSGRRQEEIVQYQGFLEVADREGWSVLVISERIESQIRQLCEAGKVDAVVGNFISETWLSGLPEDVITVHTGLSPLGDSTACVTWDMEEVGQRLRTHIQDQGYVSCWVFGPQNQPSLRAGLQAEGQFRTSESLREACSDLRNSVVVCPTDYGARVAFRVIRDAGVEVPERLGIAGVGGSTLDAVLSESFLSTVQLPYAEKGRRSAEVLRDQLNGKGAQQVCLPPIRILSGASTRKSGAQQRLQDQADSILRANLQSPPPVEEWARRSGMSRRGYERAFAAETGCTPYEYLLRLREQEARRLLRETTLPLYRIGEAVGIPDPPRFSAFFKKRVGEAASEWRKKFLGIGAM